MSEYDKGYQRGQQETFYNGSGNNADWAGWQQGQALKQSNEEQLRQHMMAGTGNKPDYSGLAAHGGGGIGNLLVILAIVAFIFILPYLLFALTVSTLVVVTAALSAPFLRLAARLIGLEYTGGFKRGFFLLAKSLGAYSAVFVGLFAVFGLLGHLSYQQSFMNNFTYVSGAAINFLVNPHSFAYVSWLSIIGTIGALQIPSLAAFSYVMRKSGALFTKDGRGFWQGMVTGFAIVSLSGGLVLSLASKIISLM